MQVVCTCCMLLSGVSVDTSQLDHIAMRVVVVNVTPKISGSTIGGGSYNDATGM